MPNKSIEFNERSRRSLKLCYDSSNGIKFLAAQNRIGNQIPTLDSK